ncbi:hypothetical protein NT2_04_02090 [Caenibius tardaugens NBRC 16725]|uniref:Heparinase II/III-like protein n=1 Tax=Caenibius tardaugens NBRC 16725 TaxID=1219035 RepID=U2YKI2_9SPHN|nr:hypothetical protein [Caenibius tardaugens]AZI36120.1 hypothetical protein EGO55_09240 [Caenibius tardaugens NBRC 16725]GAD48797.1 hypothetical protein NT2_04_02090 [Caenibius tardaugens NBRC 16725]
MTDTDGAPLTARDALALRALAELPKLLTLQDRTPVSPTYGCFDRAYWHYRMMDFPCGMSQEFVLPLALAWSLDMPGNRWFGDPAIREWAIAGIRYAARSAHADGSCDDYYPFERAAGAAAFSLYAVLHASEILGCADDPEIAAFMHLRAGWLAYHKESGRLSNHEALIVTCLARLGDMTSSPEWETPLAERVARLKSWQDEEGWFDEYGGADPGYLSLTIGLLAETDRLRPDLGLREPCARAIAFLADFVHPDGTLGGEYTSRGTRNFFPHGFEIAGAWNKTALRINDRALRPLQDGRQPCYSDDHIVGHHLWSWMRGWAEWRDERPAPLPAPDGRTHFGNARLLVDHRAGSHLFLGTSRGGAFKLYDDGALVVSDTGPTLATQAGKVAVTHLDGSRLVEIEEDRLVIEGRMAWAKSARLTPAKSVILRVLMLGFGRFFPDLIRRLLQAVLVTGRQDAPFTFRRTFLRRGGGWQVHDEVTPEQGWQDIAMAGISGFQTSTTTIMARVWAPDQAQPWLDLTDDVTALQGNAPLVVERTFGGGA